MKASQTLGRDDTSPPTPAREHAPTVVHVCGSHFSPVLFPVNVHLSNYAGHPPSRIQPSETAMQLDLLIEATRDSPYSIQSGRCKGQRVSSVQLLVVQAPAAAAPVRSGWESRELPLREAKG